MPKKSEKKKPEKEEKPEKTKKLSQLEFEKKVIGLGEKGLTSEKIGNTLMKEGIHPKEYSKKISRILKEKKIYISPDLKNIEKKLDRIKQHHEKHKHDRRAMREKERVFSQLRILKNYLQKKSN